MLFTRDITVAANTLKNAPKTEILKIAHGIITWVSVLEPPGCHGMVHCVILHHEHQIAPSTLDMSMVGDAIPIEWNEYYESYQPPYELKIQLWSPGTIYSHIVTVRVAIMPRKAVIIGGIIDAIKGLFGLVSPTRVYTAPPEEVPPEEVPPEEVPPEEVPPPPEEIPPPPAPICLIGETKCIDYDLFECIEVKGKAVWALKEENSTFCGYAPPPPPPLKLSGKILEITWEKDGVTHPLSDPRPRNETILHHFRIKNTGDEATFKAGWSYYDAFVRGEVWVYSEKKVISPGEGVLDWQAYAGGPYHEEVKFTLFANEQKVDEKTEMVIVE